jgi:hypothetical protein
VIVRRCIGWKIGQGLQKPGWFTRHCSNCLSAVSRMRPPSLCWTSIALTTECTDTKLERLAPVTTMTTALYRYTPFAVNSCCSVSYAPATLVLPSMPGLSRSLLPPPNGAYGWLLANRSAVFANLSKLVRSHYTVRDAGRFLVRVLQNRS